MRRKKLKERHIRKVIDGYHRMGKSAADTASTLGVCVSTLLIFMRKHNIRRRPRGRPRLEKNRATIKERWWEIWRARREGLTYREVGERFNVSGQYAWEICREVEKRRGE